MYCTVRPYSTSYSVLVSTRRLVVLCTMASVMARANSRADFRPFRGGGVGLASSVAQSRRDEREVELAAARAAMASAENGAIRTRSCCLMASFRRVIVMDMGSHENMSTPV